MSNSFSFNDALDIISSRQYRRAPTPARFERSYIVNEAAYRAQTIAPLLNKLGRVFGKRFGDEFRVLAPEQFKRSDGVKGTGYRMINSLGHQLRVNFRGVKTALSDEFSKSAMYINGIDYWAPDNNNWERATINVNFSADCNILQIYNRLLALVKAGKKGKFTLQDLASSSMDEAVSKADKSDFLKNKGLKSSAAWGSNKSFEKYLADNNALDEWYAYIDTGVPETNSTATSMNRVEKKFNEIEYSDPDTVFDDIEQMVTFLARSKDARTVIVSGLGGVGKTYHITKALKAFGTQGKDWTYHGAMNVSPNSFFGTVFGERDKVICFDEADAILGNKDIIVMLKPLLDTSGDHRAEWSIQTAPMALRSNEEIRAYCDNLSQGLLQGTVEAVWSRSISDAERTPDFFRPGTLDSILDAKDSGQPSEVTECLMDILPEPMAFEKQLKQKLTDDYGMEASDVKSIVSRVVKVYTKFVENPEATKLSADDSTFTARYPSIFFFDGKMIFISNMDKNKFDQAITSRASVIDVQLRATDIKNRIITILKSDSSFDDVRDQLLAHLEQLEPSGQSINQDGEIEYTTPELKKSGKQLTVRYMKLCADMIRSGVKDWPRLAAMYC